MKVDFDKKYSHFIFSALIIIFSSITFFLLLTRWSSVKESIDVILKVLTPFLWGLLVAYLLTPILNFMEKKFLLQFGNQVFKNNPKKAASFSRSSGIVLSLGLFFIIVTVLLILTVTQLYSNLSNIERLIVNMPEFFNQLTVWSRDLLQNNPEIENIVINIINNIYEYFINFIQTSLLPSISQFIYGVSSGVVSLFNGVLNSFIALVVAIYVMFNKETHGAQVKKLLYSIFNPLGVESILKSIAFVHKAFGGFLSGKILDSLIIGIICFIGMTILRLPSAGLISIIIGITNIIPFFGPFIGAVPGALLILLDSPLKVLVFIAFIIALQQFDGNILGPKILGSSTGLTGVWVLFAIVVGGGLFGFPGMVCGVPVFSIIYAGIKHLCTTKLIERNLPVETEAYIIKNPPDNRK